MKRIICLLVGLCASSAQGSMDPNILSPPWQEGVPVPTVVLDIDNTLCRPLTRDRSHSARIFQHSPETTLIPYYEQYEPEDRGFHMHAFFPGTPELFMTLLSWGWNVHIFSTAVERRNVKVIPMFLEQGFTPYFAEPAPVVEELMKKRIRIHSRDQLLRSRSPLSVRVTEDPHPVVKKDLARVGLDPQHAVLADDQLKYAVEGDQYPPICLNSHAADIYDRYHLSGRNHEQDHSHDATQNAAYILGVLDHCREFMREGNTLRSSLRRVLSRPENMQYDKKDKWLLVGPGSSLYCKCSEKDTEAIRFVKQFIDQHIARGTMLINAFKLQRTGKIQSQISTASYEDLMQTVYGVRSHDETPLRSSQDKREDFERRYREMKYCPIIEKQNLVTGVPLLTVGVLLCWYMFSNLGCI